MSNFLIFKAAFNNSATPAIGTYTAEGATARFNRNTSISPDYYLYNTALYSAVQWFVPTAETTDFEFVADILTRGWDNRITYFIIADSTGTTRLRMWSVNDNWHFENSDSIGTSGTEYIGSIDPTTSGGFGVFHQFRVRVRKLTASSSSVEVYVDGTLKLTATAGAALITCAKIGFVGGVNSFGPGTGAGIKNAYVYDLSGGDVIDRGVLSEGFNRFISWAKNIFATKDNVVLRSGGNIMTGTNLGRPNDDGTLSISGGTTVGGNTGYIKCYGASASTYPGAVEIGGKNTRFIFRNGAIESWAGHQDLGSSGRRFGTAYIEALNINGTAAGDILTHNASEFVNVTGAQTIAGDKDFTGTTGTHDVIPATTDTYDLGSSTKEYNNAYVKALTVNGTAAGDILTHNASEFVPVSGGAVLTGILFTRNDTNSSISFRSGPNYNDGASIQLKGKAQTDASGGRLYLTAHDGTNYAVLTIWPIGDFILTNALTLKAATDNVCSCGASDRRWTEVYAATGTINTSDSRLKNSVKDIDDKLLDAWGNIEPKQYKFNDATEKKGEKARYHTGYLAQDIQAECEKQGVNASDYGLFCYDEWEEQEEVSEEVETEKDGKKVKEKHVIQPKREKGNLYALRYEEALVVECKYLRRCIARLTARIEQLEKGKEQEASK